MIINLHAQSTINGDLRAFYATANHIQLNVYLLLFILCCFGVRFQSQHINLDLWLEVHLDPVKISVGFPVGGLYPHICLNKGMTTSVVIGSEEHFCVIPCF